MKWSIEIIEFLESIYSLLFAIRYITIYSDLVIRSRKSYIVDYIKLSTLSLPSISYISMKFNLNATRGTKNLILEPGTRRRRRIFSSI